MCEVAQNADLNSSEHQYVMKRAVANPSLGHKQQIKVKNKEIQESRHVQVLIQITRETEDYCFSVHNLDFYDFGYSMVLYLNTPHQ